MQKAEKRLLAILRRAKVAGMSTETISNEIFKEIASEKKFAFSNRKKFIAISVVLIGTVLVFLLGSYFTGRNSECILEMPFDSTKVFRKPEDCVMCRMVTKVDRVTNISQLDFDEFYASVARPVIVTDGTRDWSARTTFDYQFFKNLYEEHQGGKTECQFFPYKTEFHSLREALNMSRNRSLLEEGTKPWYIGWSNCNDGAGKILRQHYQRPYFLPDTSENMALSWIFMGGPGDGAHMHVDNVRYASWQAQLRGRKKWRLAPPPECYYVCKEFDAIVEPGEIIVVDTNRWYHQTHILPGDISITIGTEFD